MMTNDQELNTTKERIAKFQGWLVQMRRTARPEEFEAALKPGKKTDWYDDALYYYAEWMMNQGRTVPLKDGNWRQEPDFVKALELFRRLVKEFSKGETRYWDQAQNQIHNITDPQVSTILLMGDFDFWGKQQSIGTAGYKTATRGRPRRAD